MFSELLREPAPFCLACVAHSERTETKSCFGRHLARSVPTDQYPSNAASPQLSTPEDQLNSSQISRGGGGGAVAGDWMRESWKGHLVIIKNKNSRFDLSV